MPEQPRGLYKDLPPNGRLIVTVGVILGMIGGLAMIWVLRGIIGGAIVGVFLSIGGMLIGGLIGRGIAIVTVGKEH